MGDNLYIARQFATSAMADMLDICVMDKSPITPAAIETAQVKLSALQSGAKGLGARAIYQSAQDVIDVLKQPSLPYGMFEMRVSDLSHLIMQYETGLSDVEAQMAQIDTGSPMEDIPEDMPAAKIKPEAEMNPEQAYSTAKQMLTDLLPLAKDDELGPLNHLMDYDPNAEPINAEPINSEVINSEPIAETVMKSEIIEAAQIPLEYLLRDVIQDALSIARISGKTISISYDVGQEYMPETDILSLEKRLCEGLRALILQSLPQEGVGHLDISLLEQNVIIGCKYPAPRLLPNGLKSQDLEVGSRLILPLITSAQITEDEPLETGISLGQDMPETQPMITPENEKHLRAQLQGLMDWPNAIPDTHQQAQLTPDDMLLDDNISIITDLTLSFITGDVITDKDELGAGR